MSKDNLENHPSNDLTKSLSYVFSLLERGAKKRNDDLHLLTLSTVNAENQPQSRNVVLRKFDVNNSIIRFHTDIRSSKIQEITNNSSVSLIGYDKKNKLQIRISANAVIEDNKKSLSEIWSNMYPMSRECYRVTEEPGKIISSISDVSFQDEGEDKLNGFENFVVINCKINIIETLFLFASGHIRAKYNYKDKEFHGEWLVP